ncbi:MAG TPA: hypothetical protein VFX92_10585 [Candidatus Krumholzibacteria bacterium]|nr:hypothetical protein [Candidatus Krumholzibacteria bacterium]
MDNNRFIAALNAALRETRLDPSIPAPAGNPAAVAAWAAFLHACVGRGVSITDPRWERLVLRHAAGRPVLALGDDARAGDEPGEADDFRLGLSLLMSLLGDEDGGSPDE